MTHWPLLQSMIMVHSAYLNFNYFNKQLKSSAYTVLCKESIHNQFCFLLLKKRLLFLSENLLEID